MLTSPAAGSVSITPPPWLIGFGIARIAMRMLVFHRVGTPVCVEIPCPMSATLSLLLEGSLVTISRYEFAVISTGPGENRTVKVSGAPVAISIGVGSDG